MLPGDTPADPGARLSDVGEHNVERLLGAAYRPEDPDPQFARQLTARLCAAARAGRPAEAPRPDDERWRPVRRRLGWAMALAASVAVVALVLYAAQRRAESPPDTSAYYDDASPVKQASQPGAEPSFGLTPRARPE